MLDSFVTPSPEKTASTICTSQSPTYRTLSGISQSSTQTLIEANKLDDRLDLVEGEVGNDYEEEQEQEQEGEEEEQDQDDLWNVSFVLQEIETLQRDLLSPLRSPSRPTTSTCSNELQPKEMMDEEHDTNDDIALLVTNDVLDHTNDDQATSSTQEQPIGCLALGSLRGTPITANG